MTRLLLVRHGVTGWNREGRFQGHLDPELSDEGRLEAALLGDRMAANPEERPPLVVTSSLARAAQTAEILAQRLGASGPMPAVRADPRLMEIGQGAWEGRMHAEIAVTDAVRYARWRSTAHQEPPGAEPLDDVSGRASAALDVAVAQAGAGTVCIVSHGGTLRIACEILLGLDRLRAWAMDLDNCSVSSLLRDGDGPWLLERWNDTAHLLGRTAAHVDESEGEPLAL